VGLAPPLGYKKLGRLVYHARANIVGAGKSGIRWNGFLQKQLGADFRLLFSADGCKHYASLPVPDSLGHPGIGCPVFCRRRLDENPHRASAYWNVGGPVGAVQIHVKNNRLFRPAGLDRSALSLRLYKASAESAVDFAGLLDNGSDAGLSRRGTFGLQYQGHGENLAAVD